MPVCVMSTTARSNMQMKDIVRYFGGINVESCIGSDNAVLNTKAKVIVFDNADCMRRSGLILAIKRRITEGTKIIIINSN